MSRIKVMIVDDSAVVRQVMKGLLDADAGVEVIGVAADPIFAMERMKREWPDVILLDVEMPRMDGITFLRKIMQERPTPVVICSTLTEAGAQTTIEALAAGAVTIITKPKVGLKDFLHDASSELTHAIRMAARANVRRHAPAPAGAKKAALPLVVSAKNSADVMLAPVREKAMARTTERIVAIGTSTGGTQALEHVLTELPAVSPAIVIVQHMPPSFTAAFASRLNALCEIEVREARNNDRVVPGCALVAPGGKHMLLKRSGAQYQRGSEGWAAGEPALPVGGCLVSVCRHMGGRECAGRNHDRHGRRWRPRAQRDARCGRANHRAGRGQLRGVRDAEGSDSAGCGGARDGARRFVAGDSQRCVKGRARKARPS
jgi:two-component system, chemotaxis family, protein-glutamate methylesterase/glutaminase